MGGAKSEPLVHDGGVGGVLWALGLEDDSGSDFGRISGRFWEDFHRFLAALGSILGGFLLDLEKVLSGSWSLSVIWIQFDSELSFPTFYVVRS